MAFRHIKLHSQAFVSAIQFLTRFPIPATVPFKKQVLTRSVIYFPAAGGLIALCVAVSGWLIGLVLPPWPTAVLTLAVWTALSGGLHMDGWMDTADGIGSHRSKERILEIMKDSRVGAMGVIAAVFVVLLKASLLAELIGREGGAGPGLIAILVMSACWSRAWMGIAIAGWPPARPGEGIGHLFNGVKGIWAGMAAIAAAVISFMALSINGVNIGEAIIITMSAFVVASAVGGCMAVWLNGKLGGLTGDTYGAINEAIETAILLAAVIWLNG